MIMNIIIVEMLVILNVIKANIKKALKYESSVCFFYTTYANMKFKDQICLYLKDKSFFCFQSIALFLKLVYHTVTLTSRTL